MVRRFCDKCGAEVWEEYYTNVHISAQKANSVNFQTGWSSPNYYPISCVACFEMLDKAYQHWNAGEFPGGINGGSK